MEQEIIGIVKKSGLSGVLIIAVYLLYKQYTASIERALNREKEFYSNIESKLNEIDIKIEQLKRNNDRQP